MKSIPIQKTTSKLARVHSIKPVVDRFPSSLVLKDRSGWDIIPFDEIIKCEADSNYSKVYKTDGSVFVTCMTLKQLEKKLSTRKFIRTHQSFIVAISQIRRIQQTDILLSNNQTIPVARRKRNEILELLDLK